MEITIKSLDDIRQAARTFIDNAGDRRVFAFHGNMGAGKTTFIKAICEELGVEDVVTSPTFAIINEYRTRDGKPVYHFDFYRVKNTDELQDIGCEDYFYSGAPCFIEWPDLAEPLLPEDTANVNITANADGSRTITTEG